MIAGALALLAATITALELVRGLRLLAGFAALGRIARRAAKLLPRTGVSEWAKERALKLVAARMLHVSLGLMLKLALVASPILAVLALDHVRPFGVARAFMDVPTRIALILIVLSYAVARRRLAGSGGERLLNRVALGSRPLLELSFDIERGRFDTAAMAAPWAPPVFVAGLARAGTSVLVRALHGAGGFASLSYRDLPFPLAPNAWAAMARHLHRRVDAVERGHGDGLTHDLDSPEAIEELFWLMREGERYRDAGGLRVVAPQPGTIDAFRRYVRLVLLRYGRARYVSKNNNNILRTDALVAAFPDATLIHPFRAPLQQAASLRAQHVRACALAAEDPYRRDFMRWLGHHEFGADRRPFLFPDGPAPRGDPAGIDHWLELWIVTYRHLLGRPEAVARRQLFVDYDAATGDPGALAAALRAALGLDAGFDCAAFRPPARHEVGDADPTLRAEAEALHADLKRRSLVPAAGGMLPEPVVALAESPAST